MLLEINVKKYFFYSSLLTRVCVCVCVCVRACVCVCVYEKNKIKK